MQGINITCLKPQSIKMSKLEIGKEYIAPNEPWYYDQVADILIEQEQKKYVAGKTLRIFHAQTHGCVKAEFIINDNLPEELRVGLFKAPGSFPAFIRFSNSDDTVKSDMKKGIRGAAIKIMNVPGSKLLESKDVVSSQDFVLFSTRSISPNNVQHNYEGIKAVYGGKLKLLGFLIKPSHWYIMRDQLKNPCFCPNILEIPFYSTTPYKYGEGKAVKYSMVPRVSGTSTMPGTPSDTFIRERMIATLMEKEVWYDFKVQFQTDADTMPMEDASVEWSSPFITIGAVKLPVQKFDDPAQFTFAENLTFNIWHTLPEHQPLGGLNRARQSVYQKLSAYRLQRNGGVNEQVLDGMIPAKTTAHVHAARNPLFSSWLTAIEETINKNPHYYFHWHLFDKKDAHPMLQAASAHVNAVQDGVALPAYDAATTDPHGEDMLQILSDHFFNWAEAQREKDIIKIGKYKQQHLQYSKFDTVGWTSSVVTYLENFKTGNDTPVYRGYDDYGKGDLNTSVIDYKLPNDAKIGLIADWGTGSDCSREMLIDILQNHDLDAIIHLGDIYYSGTLTQCKENFYDIFAEAFKKTGKQIPVFMIPGNHDYYAFGHGFFWLVDAQNPASQPTWKQDASFFCLRTEDSSWQLLGMDTGIGDYKPQDQIGTQYTGPELKDSEVVWHMDKLDNFEGRTILLSHHQLFSSNGRIDKDNTADSENYNEHLYKVFSPYFPKVGAWIWGHEHTMAFYKDGYKGLSKGRLIGCGSYNDATVEDPYKVNFPKVEYIDNMPKLGVIDNYYNHGFAVLDLERKEKTDPLKISYYQLPVWNDGVKKALPKDQPYKLFEEEIV